MDSNVFGVVDDIEGDISLLTYKWSITSRKYAEDSNLKMTTD